jgi:hypothetical protein
MPTDTQRGIAKLQITVREGVDDWLVELPGRAVLADSGADAYRVISDYLQGLAKEGQSTLTVLTWETTTSIGASVVKVLSDRGGSSKSGRLS